MESESPQKLIQPVNFHLELLNDNPVDNRKSEFCEAEPQQVEDDLASVHQNFSDFNRWIISCTSVTPYPFSKEIYGISSKSYKFQTSMAMILAALTLSENFTTSEMAKALGTVRKKLSPNTSVNSTSIYLKLSINASILKELVDDALYSGSSKKESNNAFFIFSSSSESESNGTSFKINTFLYNAAKIIAIEVWNL